MLKDFVNIIKNHLDFRIYPVAVIPIIIAVLTIPCVKFLPVKFGYENGVLENIQLIILFAACVMGFCAKTNKKFFRFAALVVIILILREINCGRTIFFPYPGIENAFYQWKDIKYGWLANPLYGIFIASVGLYFVINKLYLNLFEYIKKVKFPVWNIVLLVLGMLVGMYSEKALNNMLLEEMAEMLFYSSLMGIVWLYGFNKNFEIK